MADKSAIEWTEATWNPTTGCDRISPGCDNCYALKLAKRLKGMGSAKYQTDGDPRTSGPGFGLAMHVDTLDTPFGWKKPRTVFVNSMSDLFHDKASDEYIAKVFAVMSRTPQHTYQILTKRHARMRALLNSGLFWIMVNAERFRAAVPVLRGGGPVLLPNVWLGVSVENQQWADIRIPALLQTPAAVRFLSCEPLLGPLNLMHEGWLLSAIDRYEDRGVGLQEWCPEPGGIDWVIAGGESGLGARPMNPDWVRSLRDQCARAGVPYFFKQWGAWATVTAPYRETDSEMLADGYRWPLSQPHGAGDGTEVVVRRVGKKAAGRELDGRTHDEYPEAGE